MLQRRSIMAGSLHMRLLSLRLHGNARLCRLGNQGQPSCCEWAHGWGERGACICLHGREARAQAHAHYTGRRCWMHTQLSTRPVDCATKYPSTNCEFSWVHIQLPCALSDIQQHPYSPAVRRRLRGRHYAGNCNCCHTPDAHARTHDTPHACSHPRTHARTVAHTHTHTQPSRAHTQPNTANHA